MTMSMMFTVVSMIAFAIQFLIFAYLFSSHRVRFFEYLLWAWGAYTVSKAAKMIGTLMPGIADPMAFASGVASVVAVGFTLAAALAHRWDYRVTTTHVGAAVALAMLLELTAAASGGDAGWRVVGVGLGVVQIAAGVLFWPFGRQLARFRGERLLAGVIILWGVHRIAVQLVAAEPGTVAYGAMHGMFVTFYFLATFAIIIMVLERARSESERLHARLREAERLAMAGEFAAGMAHEIRNPLAAIVNATALLTDPTGLSPEERATTLAAVRTEARRLNRILSDFLHLARPAEARLAPGDIRHVVEHVTALIREDRSRAPAVDVKVAMDPAVPRFAFDRDQVTQVLWNVALNGVEAMNGRGRLSMEVTRNDGHVALAVSDTGRGIPPEQVRRVFEPFYSGKHNGSGLGLTIANRIVSAHGGRIEVASEPGRGTRVTMLFPLDGAARG